MITVTITRQKLVELGACPGGLELFDAITAHVAPHCDVIQIVEWTVLHDLWISTSEFVYWLRENRLVPDPNLRRAYLRSADLHGAYLRSADLHGAYLRSADLHGADLRSANLRRADLRSANLRRADLRSADLHGAYLRSADLHGAYLWEAYLHGAYRSAHDPSIPGWVVSDGRLVRA